MRVFPNALLLFFASIGFEHGKSLDAADNSEAVSKVVSVSLFKNGLASIRRQVNLPSPGKYTLSDVPEPVHGTFFVESNDSIQASIVPIHEIQSKTGTLGRDVQRELAGLNVLIRVRSSNTPVTGVVLPTANPSDSERKDSLSRTIPPGPPSPMSRFLVVQDGNRYSYVDLNEIVSIDTEAKPAAQSITDETTKSKLVLELAPKSKGGVTHISYLTHGISWAPNYRLDLVDEKSLTVEQQAIVRNELEELNETEISVISGYPSVQFGHVVSPFAATQSWAQFFQQLNGRTANMAFTNSMITQNSAYGMGMSGNSGSAPVIAPNVGDTLDLYYHSIGKQDMKKGGSLAVSTGKAKVAYQRVVEWNIPDTRDEWGTPNNNRRVDPTTGEQLQDDVWDSLKFRNSLPFPMTSAAALVTTSGRFSGQGQILWTNRNEEATCRVNKALSIRARHMEYENTIGDPGQAERGVVYLGGRRFRKVSVHGELRLCNHRPVDIQMNIQRQFSGDYVSGDATPKIDLREEGVWSLNKRNQLVWNISLKPAEERTIKYQYTVLVPF